VSISRLIPLLLVTALIGCRVGAGNSTAKPQELTIAAAANVNDLLGEAAKGFERKEEVKVTIAAGSTGYLAAQIEHGAPFDLFISADVQTVDRLISEGKLEGQTKRIYARGQLVLWQPADAPTEISQLTDLAKPGFKKIAMANPDLAPYGRAALETLNNAGLIEKVKDKLVYGENVGQAKQYAETGNAQAVFISKSLARSGQGRAIAVDGRLHRPIDQALAVITSSRHQSEARRFIEYLASSEGVKLLQEYGYQVP
jgi:molybdate transport system substrate-binding protein